MAGRTKKFGAFIRREREGRDIGLREMAKMIGVSPTYLSKIERDEFPPPAEDKVKAIAKIIQFDSDDLLARAGRVSFDITSILIRYPELSAVLRNASIRRTAMTAPLAAGFIEGQDNSPDMYKSSPSATQSLNIEDNDLHASKISSDSIFGLKIEIQNNHSHFPKISSDSTFGMKIEIQNNHLNIEIQDHHLRSQKLSSDNKHSGDQLHRPNTRP
jgi:transcriptional regulator with XRE-family HTH domain